MYPAVLFMYFNSAAFILLVPLALIVQVSLPYNNTERASVLYNFILVFLRVFLWPNTFSKFYRVYYLILVYRLFIFPVGVLSNILFSKESYDMMIGHSKLEEIGKREVTYRAKQELGASGDQDRVAGDRSHSVEIE
jgi:hypothetical protein